METSGTESSPKSAFRVMQNIFYRCSCTRTQLVFIREFDEQSKVKKRHQLSVIWDYIHTLTGEKPQCNEDTRNLKQNNYHVTVVLVWRALIRSVCLCLPKFSNMTQKWLWRTVMSASRASCASRQTPQCHAEIRKFWKKSPSVQTITHRRQS